MEMRPLAIDGAWEIIPQRFADDRGYFLEWFKDARFSAATGHDLDLRQANLSVSRSGVVRGIHYADVPPGQAKYVVCAAGAVVDVVVDLREGSPTFGRWEPVLLDSADPRAVYISEGLGHAFVALEDRSTVLYLCSTGYRPEHEHAINPLDPDLAIAWDQLDSRLAGTPLVLSEKDAAAPSLETARASGTLPSWSTASGYVATLRARHDEGAAR